MLKTFEEMCDDESICDYCYQTDFGKDKSFVTPDGYVCCEGAFCQESYESYLDENKTTENVVKYASAVKLTNKEEVNGITT